MGAFDIALRASVVVLVSLTASAALRRGSAALRHRVLAVGIFSAAAVVPLGLMLPGWDVPTRSVGVVPKFLTAVSSAPSDSATFDLRQPLGDPPATVEKLVTLVWVFGSAISAAAMLVGLSRLFRLTRRATPVTDLRWLEPNADLAARHGVGGVALLKSDRPDLLATWGLRRACVLLPAHCESWSDARIHVVLSHELAHIRRADWGIQIAAEMVRAVFWFNPFFWIACAQLRRDSEQACDIVVLDAGVRATEYASHLVAIARACRPSSRSVTSAMPIARPSTLEWRITAMLNTRLTRTAPSRRTMALAAAALVAVTIPIATLRAAQSAPLPLGGSVYDTSGGVLPHVVLTLEDMAGTTRAATTDGSGRFEFEPIAPGRYVLSTALLGFRTLSQELTLRDARNWERAVTLQVETLQERVMVWEQRPPGVTPQVYAGQTPRIGGDIRPPKKLKDVRPIYPPAMRDAGFEGVVPMEALIGVDGGVTSVRVISAQVHPELAKAAVDAVRQWRFSPTLLNGVAIEVSMTVAVQFSLPE